MLCQQEESELGGLLTLYGGELFGASLNDLYKPAYGIELLHNFTLVHDDIMDHAELRRGKTSSVYQIWY